MKTAALERLVTVPGKIEDLSGLYIDLKKASFGVRNVGADQNGTHVFLEPWEKKDPAPLVEAWIGKPAPSPMEKKAFKKRIQDLEEAAAIKVEPPPEQELAPVPVVDPTMVVEASLLESDGAAAPAETAPPVAEARPTIMQKFWKIISG